MGIANTLFFDANATEKQTLHRRITLRENQFEEQQERWNELAEYLISDLKKRTNCSIRTWLQGSYKFGTQIRPTSTKDEFDIDLGVYFEWKGRPEDGDWEPREIKEIIQASLESYTGDGVISVVSPPKAKCSRISYKGKFHIDVPGYHLNIKEDKRNLATEENEWEDSDPKAIYLWFRDRFDDSVRTKVRRLIRYFKCWAGLKFGKDSGRPSSILLTVLITEAIPNLSADDLAADDDALRAVIEVILKRLEGDSEVLNPVNNDECLTDSLRQGEIKEFINMLKKLQDIADEALLSDSLLIASDKWTEAFEHFFPIGIEDLTITEEENRQLPVRATIPEVAVRAVPKDNSSKQFNKMNQIGPIPRGCDIYFKITNENDIPHDAEISWIVRNEGDEAEYINDLGHKAGFGLNAKEESAYNGKHYMDCVVKRYGVMIGGRRIPVIISGHPVPPRNPSKKPKWTRLKGRR